MGNHVSVLGDTAAVKTQWWTAEKQQAHEGIFATVASLDQSQSHVKDRYLHYLRLYMARDIAGLSPSECQALSAGLNQPLQLNVIRSCIQTVAALVTPNRPRPRFLTESGRWEHKTRSRKLEKLVDGIFDQTQAYEEAAGAFIDAAWGGTGFLKIFAADGQVKVEKVFPPEIIVDEQASMTCRPRVLFQRKYVPREVLLARFPDKTTILTSANFSDSTIAEGATPSELIEVIEAWHLPSKRVDKSKGKDDKKKAKKGDDGKTFENDGRHIWAVSSGTLVDEPWIDEDFPFVVIPWSKPPIGWLGQGLAEDLDGIQREIGSLLKKISRALDLISRAWVMKPRDCEVPDDFITNEDGIILEFGGRTPPSVDTPRSVNPENFAFLWAMYDKAYEIPGVSQLSAKATVPAGIESGKAMRELTDVQTQRFGMHERRWEQAFVQLAKKIVSLARQLYESSSADEENARSFKVQVPGLNFIETIDWKDVSLEDDQYYIKVWPTSILPKTPAGKLATVQEMLGSGLIPDETVAQALLDFPDLDKYVSLERAALDDIHWTMDKILYDGEYQEPIPVQDLELGIRWAQATYLNGRKEGAPKKNLDDLLRWVVEAKALQTGEVPGQPPIDAALPDVAEQGGLVPGMPPVESAPPPVASGGSGVPPQLAAP